MPYPAHAYSASHCSIKCKRVYVQGAHLVMVAPSLPVASSHSSSSATTSSKKSLPCMYGGLAAKYGELAAKYGAAAIQGHLWMHCLEDLVERNVLLVWQWWHQCSCTYVLLAATNLWPDRRVPVVCQNIHQSTETFMLLQLICQAVHMSMFKAGLCLCLQNRAADKKLYKLPSTATH